MIENKSLIQKMRENIEKAMKERKLDPKFQELIERLKEREEEAKREED